MSIKQPQGCSKCCLNQKGSGQPAFRFSFGLQKKSRNIELCHLKEHCPQFELNNYKDSAVFIQCLFFNQRKPLFYETTENSEGSLDAKGTVFLVASDSLTTGAKQQSN